jgi:branched-chain amino acid transport system substrate-binding protein
MRRTKFALAAAALAAVLTFAACGSTSSTSSGTTSNAAAASAPAAAPSSASTVSGQPITVGFVCSCTGPLATTIGRSEDVIQAWAKWTNAHGGLNGHPVKVIAIDDGQDPAKGLEAVKSLVQQDKVMAIVGQESLTSESWAKYIASTGVPVVGGQPVDTPFLTNPDFFVSGSNLLMNVFGQVELAKQTGKKHLGLFYCAETPVCAQAPALIGALAKPMGIAVTSERVSSTAPSYIAPCPSLKQQGVDSVIVAMNSTIVPRVLDACAQQGYRPVNLASSATTERSWTKDANLDGSLVAAANADYTDQSVPGVKSFTDALNQYVPGLTGSSQYSWGYLDMWAGGELFAAAAKAAKLTPTSTPADVKKGLYALRNETLDGLAPPLIYAPGRPGFPACYFEAKLTNGEFAPLGGDKPVCAPPAVIKQLAAALGA